jgi:UDP-N-acetylglucosamine 2-epimerase (non-hydrolysing)
MNDRLKARTVWLVGGTRPEAIKLAPVAIALASRRSIHPVVVATGQHPSMFQKGLSAFGLQPDRELQLDRVAGGQAELVAQMTERLDAQMQVGPPDAVVVQGDTTSALVGALVAFWRQIPVVHLEAGLRSHDLAAPFPEEANRRMVDHIAALHLAPTQAAAANLLAEGISADSIEVIGNTVVDAALLVAGAAQRFNESALEPVDALVRAGRRLLLVTAHRRESWGRPMRSVLHAVRDILDEHPDCVAVLPVHPNPSVRADVVSVLGTDRRVIISPPVDYPDLIRLLELSTLVLSDSGGIQEESPSFGVLVLVLREKTERIEAIQAGCAFLVGTDRARIVAEAARLLSGGVRRRTTSNNPFGDGRAGERAAIALAQLVGVSERPKESTPAKLI